MKLAFSCLIYMQKKVQHISLYDTKYSNTSYGVAMLPSLAQLLRLLIDKYKSQSPCILSYSLQPDALAYYLV